MKKDGAADKNPLAEIKTDGGFTSILGTVGCIGDSLSSGEHEYLYNGNKGYYDMYEYSWGQFLARKCGLKVYNFSRGGLTAKEFHKYADHTLAFYPDKLCRAYIIFIPTVSAI